MDVKKCGSCREIKSVDDFVARRDGSGKHLPRCKACRDAETQTKRQEAQERQRERQKNKQVERKPTNLARTPLKPMSDKRKLVNKQRKEAMLAHFGKRELWKCQMRDLIGTPCFGEINGHEILSRARSGQSDANLLDMSGIILACNHHNEWCESNPKEAHALGLTKHFWE